MNIKIVQMNIKIVQMKQFKLKKNVEMNLKYSLFKEKNSSNEIV